MPTSILAAGAFCGLCLGSIAQAATSSMQTNVPTRQEVRAALERGLAFLEKAQNSNGWWSTPDQPAVTALVLTAMNLEPPQRLQRHRTSEMNRGCDYLLSCVNPDGSIQKAGLANYNTSLSLMAFTTAADASFLPVILKAREIVASTQVDLGVKGTNDTPFDGGVGYGSKYGSMSYGGLLSCIYARMSQDDPRVIAVKDWLRSNYTIDENPGMGQQGYFYYLHLLTKALTASGEDRLKLTNGAEVLWRDQVAARLLTLQRADGSWVNPEPRWWEADPVLVTCYAVMTPEMLEWKMP